MNKAKRLIEMACPGPAVAPGKPITKPGTREEPAPTRRKHPNPFRRKEIKPGEEPRPKAHGYGGMPYESAADGVAKTLIEGGHKAGCQCGFCKNKGKFGKKKEDEGGEKPDRDADDKTEKKDGGDVEHTFESVGAKALIERLSA